MNDGKTVTANLVAMEVKALVAREAKIAEEALVAREALAKDTDALKNLVRDGNATTGDRITDYFIAAHGVLDDAEISKPLRELQGRMSGKKGELFLVALHESKRHTFGGPNFQMGRRDYHTETRYFLGVLDEDTLFFDQKGRRCGLPAKKHLELSFDVKTIEHEGPFIFSNVTFYGPRPTAAFLGFGAEPNAVSAEVMVGDVETLGYVPGSGAFSMSHNSWIVLRNRIIRMAGKEVPEAPEEVAAREKARGIFTADLNKTHSILVAHATGSTEGRKDFDDAARKKMTDMVLSTAEQLGMEADLLVQLVLKEIREAPR